MIYVLKTQKNNDIIMFDTITSFSESYQGSVTSHPVEDGTKISDNVVTENVRIKIQGVVSDYNFWNPLKDAANASVPHYNIGDSRFSSMGNIDTNGRTVFSDEQVPQDYTSNKDNSSVKSAMFTVRDRLIRIQREKELITVLAYTLTGNDSEITRYENCVITDLSFDTSPDSGYAIYPNISIEQVTTVKVKTQFANAQQITEEKVANQASGEDGKGNKKPAKGSDSAEKAAAKRDDAYTKVESQLELEMEKARCLELWNNMLASGQKSPPMCAIRFNLVDKTSARSLFNNPATL